MLGLGSQCMGMWHRKVSRTPTSISRSKPKPAVTTVLTGQTKAREWELSPVRSQEVATQGKLKVRIRQGLVEDLGGNYMQRVKG